MVVVINGTNGIVAPGLTSEDSTGTTTLTTTTLVLGGTTITATGAELNYNDITTLGTVQASKVVTADASGNVTFPDGEILQFGTSGDLQLQHNGVHSYITDAGTGNLYIQTTAGLIVQNANGTSTMASFVENGAVDLRYANSTKLVTTLTGIQTTGTISVNGAYTLPTADGGANQALVTNGAGALSFANVSLTPEVIDSDTTATVSKHYFLNASGITLTLPASPSVGDRIGVTELVGSTTSVIAPNGNAIMGDSADLTIDNAYLVLELAYTGAAVGWAFA